MNLVLNAIQATPPSGEVRVSLEESGDDAVMLVEDTGPGIPADLRERIFEPFFTTKESGTGLGLPLCHSLIQQHGGSIVLEEAPGGGARFVVRLPRGV
jgi:signal transduction histidine kinase